MKRERAQVLVEALPYIKKFQGKTFVIKYGGSIMSNEEARSAFIEDVVLFRLVGINIVIVHGGGPNINKMLDRLNIETEFRSGLRVTDESVMEVVEMTLSGQVNKAIVGELSQHGLNAVGLSGRDSRIVKAVKHKPLVDGKEVDLGYVGKVTDINTELLRNLIGKKFLPIISPIGADDDGQIYNINADYVAAAIAGALECEKLILLTDTRGIYKDFNDSDTFISRLNVDKARKYIEKGYIQGGMIPKLESCIESLKQGTKSVHLIDGRKLHSLLLEVFTDDGAGDGAGTMVTL